MIHAGDFTFFSRRPWMYGDFDLWLGELPHAHKIVILGNHDYLLKEPEERTVITNATLLVDSGLEIEGLKIWGSGVGPLYGGAFGMSLAAHRRKHWARIPDDTDILITHDPPLGILDHLPRSKRREGCPELMEAMLQTRPRLHVFGHVHAGYGTLRTADTIFVNASLLGDSGSLDRKPIVNDLDVR